MRLAYLAQDLVLFCLGVGHGVCVCVCALYDGQCEMVLLNKCTLNGAYNRGSNQFIECTPMRSSCKAMVQPKVECRDLDRSTSGASEGGIMRGGCWECR